jgi:hypothetical protein
MKLFLAFACFLFLTPLALAQLTILNVSSADVQDKNQLYLRVDTTSFVSSGDTTIAPNFIYGLGHNVDVGININAFGIPASFANRSIVPNVKWKFISGKADAPNHFDMYVGNQVFVPTFHGAFNVGNYLYGAGALTFHSNTRITAGVWDSQNVVVNGNRGGALLGIEQTIAHHKERSLITLAADWQSGQGSNGALALGSMFFPTDRLMIIPAFQIANSGDHTANAVVIFIGYLLKK